MQADTFRSQAPAGTDARARSESPDRGGCGGAARLVPALGGGVFPHPGAAQRGARHPPLAGLPLPLAMAVFRRLLLAALCAGLLSGVLAAAGASIRHRAADPAGRDLRETRRRRQGKRAAHDHPAAAEWEPENGFERSAYTLAADLLTGIGFALLLAAGLTLRGGDAGWHDGLFWGLAGFAAFTLAPGMGLPPELPGSEAGRCWRVSYGGLRPPRRPPAGWRCWPSPRLWGTRSSPRR